ncbi:hypothetical protein BZG35_13245 [Brevundimonas sp. LM2]|uniref:hypothetical protein n=1 Tax=Brevundimonas sp. LM2 TaxID=1938605 RepID=UPI00098406A1|nr:hypothetical protein [Brevundimonas sp. LM2]AQR62503.1 hypothetical protein BZG35_13245 [Brevundimonas sp. LM2]
MTNPTLDINGRAFWAHNGGNPRALRQVDGELRFDVRPGDVWPTMPSNERSEVCTVEKLSAFTVEFDQLVEAGPNTSKFVVLGQYQQQGEPTVALELAGDRLRVVSRNRRAYTRHYDGAFDRDRWAWLKLVIDPGEKGHLRVLRDNVEIVTFAGPLGWPGLTGHWKNGIYRAPAPETLRTRVQNLIVTPTP